MKREGSCLCGQLRYTVSGELAPVFNCHCQFCRRVHGAAFTTVGFVSAGRFSWHASSAKPSRYETRAGNHRYFCTHCSTPIYNHAPSIGLACIVVASLEEGVQPAPWAHVNTESKSLTFQISDGLPSFPSWPDPRRLVELARLHGAVLPPEMQRSTA